MRCIKCGQEFQGNSSICPYCGENNNLNKSVNELMNMNNNQGPKLDFVNDNQNINNALSDFNFDQPKQLAGMMVAEDNRIAPEVRKKSSKLKSIIGLVVLVLLVFGLVTVFKKDNNTKLDPPAEQEPSGGENPGGEEPPVVDPGGLGIDDPSDPDPIEVDPEFDGKSIEMADFDTKVSYAFEAREYNEHFLLGKSNNMAFLFTMSVGDIKSFIDDKEPIIEAINKVLSDEDDEDHVHNSKIKDKKYSAKFTTTKTVGGVTYYLFEYGDSNTRVFLARYNKYYYVQGMVQWKDKGTLNGVLKEVSNTLGNIKGKKSLPEGVEVVPSFYTPYLVITDIINLQ